MLRARVLLLGSGRLGPEELAGAYRVLAEVSPKVYGPKLVGTLLTLCNHSRDPRVKVELAAEAVRAARVAEAGAPERVEWLCRALEAYQASLFALGRRAEGRAVCEELAGAGRSGQLATVLAEEGCFGEAAALYEVAARKGAPEDSFWEMVRWAASLEGAGLHDAAAAVFRELLAETRREVTDRGTGPLLLVWALVQFARMREAVGDGASAAVARREALGVLEQLASATAGEARRWYCSLGWWSTLFVLSGRAVEPAASPESPMPPFGTERGWSRDVREGFLGMLPGLEAEAAELREAERLPELVDVLRRISIRAAVRDGDHHYRFEERFAPRFDEGVTLARRLPDDPARLARALTDRSMFLVAARSFDRAHADLAETAALLD